MLELKFKPSFKKDLERYRHNKKVLDELEIVLEMLVNEIPLPVKYKNHKLTGNYDGMLELHLKPDDLLVYIKIEKKSITLVAMGSHAYLF